MQIKFCWIMIVPIMLYGSECNVQRQEDKGETEFLLLVRQETEDICQLKIENQNARSH